AAITPDDKPLAEMDYKYYEKLMSVDLNSVALCLKYELVQMEKDGTEGSLVNTSSVSGIRPQPLNPAYLQRNTGSRYNKPGCDGLFSKRHTCQHRRSW